MIRTPVFSFTCFPSELRTPSGPSWSPCIPCTPVDFGVSRGDELSIVLKFEPDLISVVGVHPAPPGPEFFAMDGPLATPGPSSGSLAAIAWIVPYG